MQRRLAVRPVPGQGEVEHPADRPDVVLLAVRAVGPRVGQHHPAVVADHRGARVHVAVHHAGGVHGGEGAGDGVADGGRPGRVQGPVAGDQLAQGLAVHPLADHVRPVRLVDRVVDADQVGVDDPAGRDGRLEHLGGGVATRVAEDHRDGTAQHDVDPAPDQPARAVVVDVLDQLVPLGKDLTGRGSTEGHDRRSSFLRLLTLADLGHPSSLGDRVDRWTRTAGHVASRSAFEGTDRPAPTPTSAPAVPVECDLTRDARFPDMSSSRRGRRCASHEPTGPVMTVVSHVAGTRTSQSRG